MALVLLEVSSCTCRDIQYHLATQQNMHNKSHGDYKYVATFSRFDVQFPSPPALGLVLLSLRDPTDL